MREFWLREFNYEEKRRKNYRKCKFPVNSNWTCVTFQKVGTIDILFYRWIFHVSCRDFSNFSRFFRDRISNNEKFSTFIIYLDAFTTTWEYNKWRSRRGRGKKRELCEILTFLRKRRFIFQYRFISQRHNFIFSHVSE